MNQRRITIGIRRREESGTEIYAPAIIVKEQTSTLFEQTTIAIVNEVRGKTDAAREAIAWRDALDSVLPDNIAIAPGILRDAEYEPDDEELETLAQDLEGGSDGQDDAEGAEVCGLDAYQDLELGGEG